MVPWARDSIFVDMNLDRSAASYWRLKMDDWPPVMDLAFTEG